MQRAYLTRVPCVQDLDLELELKKKKKKKKPKDAPGTPSRPPCPPCACHGLSRTASVLANTEPRSAQPRARRRRRDLHSGVTLTETTPTRRCASFRLPRGAAVRGSSRRPRDQLVDRIFSLLKEKNPNLATRTKHKMAPPQLVRVGTKKVMWANFAQMCQL